MQQPRAAVRARRGVPLGVVVVQPAALLADREPLAPIVALDAQPQPVRLRLHLAQRLRCRAHPFELDRQQRSHALDEQHHVRLPLHENH
eukprot:6894330-Prymnesium_polylepis.1